MVGLQNLAQKNGIRGINCSSIYHTFEYLSWSPKKSTQAKKPLPLPYPIPESPYFLTTRCLAGEGGVRALHAWKFAIDKQV